MTSYRFFRAALVAALFVSTASAEDARNIRTGLQIPDEGYCDQPYVVITRDGNWLCMMTTGTGHEGDPGQHVVATVSRDQGQTWSDLIDIEPASGPEASWVVPLVVPSGRVYGFYTYNGERISELDGREIRTDMLGWYVFKYSDDNGRTWSKRYRLPMRVTACDRNNDWQGQVQIFWGIDKPKVFGDRVVFAFTKLGRYMLEDGEGWLFRSGNILRESDVSEIHWQMLPEGEHGIRADEFGSVQEEHNMVPLDDGSLYCVYRTTTGYPCHTYSRDGGRTWDKPVHMTYTPGGRRIKNPRACPKVWRTKEGKYLFWFHNHSGRSFQDRNPAWIAGGVEKDGRIHWSEPEILLYDPNPKTRISYPDLIEQDGRCWVTETQKTVARVHEIDPQLFEGLWNQGTVKKVAEEGLVLSAEADPLRAGSASLPKLSVRDGGGMSLDLWLQLDELSPGQVVLDSRTPGGEGLVLQTTGEGDALRLELNDGSSTAAWESDPGLLEPNKQHHVVVSVDAGPKIITFIIDGRLCDGAEHRQFGWGRYSDQLGDVSGSGTIRIAPSLQGQVSLLRMYGRCLRTSEAIANFHAGH